MSGVQSDILLALTRDQADARAPVSDFMTRDLVTIKPDASINDLIPIFKNGHVAIVLDDDAFYGIITQIDLINYLRKQLP